ncbi:MAG TPA: TIGR02270 family protein [Polyangiaceae bacterium]
MFGFDVNGSAQSDDAILWEVVEEHLDEAEYLLEMRPRCLSSSSYTLDELDVRVEQRLLAHIDGLVVGGTPVAERLLTPAICEDGAPAGKVTAAALALLSGMHADAALTRIVAALDDADPVRRTGLAQALRLAHEPRLPTLLARAVRTAQTAGTRAVLLQALAAHRTDPGPLLGDTLASEEPGLVVAGLEAVAALGRGDCVRAVDAHLGASDPRVRDAAIEAGLVLASRSAWQECQAIDARPLPSDARRILLTALLGHPERVRPYLDDPALRCDTIFALGFGGRAGDAVTLLSLLHADDDRVCKLAGEAFCTITGFTPPDPPPAPEPPAIEDDADADEAATLPPLEEDDLDADLVPDAVDELPLIDAVAAETWWRAHHGRFNDASRWLCGRIFDLDALRAELYGAPLRRRHALATALRIASGGRHTVATWAMARRQRTELAALASVRAGDLPNRL